MGIPPDDPYAQQGEPPVWNDYRRGRRRGGRFTRARPDSQVGFLQAVESPDHVLTIQTADQALWANVLLTVGCRVS